MKFYIRGIFFVNKVFFTNNNKLVSYEVKIELEEKVKWNQIRIKRLNEEFQLILQNISNFEIENHKLKPELVSSIEKIESLKSNINNEPFNDEQQSQADPELIPFDFQINHDNNITRLKEKINSLENELTQLILRRKELKKKRRDCIGSRNNYEKVYLEILDSKGEQILQRKSIHKLKQNQVLQK
jgi:hypothetical protein